MPILGIIASQISGHLAPPPVFQGDYWALNSATVPSGGVASITFSNIPQNYTHLQVRCLLRSNRATFAIDNLKIQFNGDTSASSYATHILDGDGATAASSAYASGSLNTACAGNFVAASGASTGVFGASVVDILQYTNTSINKTVRGIGGVDNNSGGGSTFGMSSFASGLWLNTSAITSITISGFNGGTLSEFSQAALYGVK
jgi:hypothetical protein